MIIRVFKPPDIKRVLEIETAAFDDPYPPGILIDIYNLGAGFLVAQHYNIVVGYIIFWIRYENESHIISLAVDKKYRKKSVGKKLLDHAITIFKKYDVKKIKLEVRIKNRGARKFYRKNGFEEKEILKDYYEDGEDAVIMKKELGKT